MSVLYIEIEGRLFLCRLEEAGAALAHIALKVTQRKESLVI